MQTKLEPHYKNLQVRMRLLRYNTSTLSKEVGISRQALDNKFSGKTEFKQSDIIKICDVLNIGKDLIPHYFFCS